MSVHPDDVSLKVEAKPAANRQLCRNPDGELGGFWWLTPIPSAKISGINATTWGAPHALAYESGVSGGPQLWASDLFPVNRAAGERPYAYLHRLLTTVDISFAFRGYDVAGTSLGTVTLGTVAAGTGTMVALEPPSHLPAGTVQASLEMSWTSAAVGTEAVFTGVKITAATSAPGSAGVAESQWIEAAPFASDITATSAGLQTGTLTASLHSEWMDPAASALIRPGAAVRLEVEGRRLWTGELTNTTSQQRKTKNFKALPPIVTLTGVDAVARLAATPSPHGVGSLALIPHQLEQAGVPWNVANNTNQVGAPSGTFPNPNASALDQLVLMTSTYASAPAFAYVDRYGVVRVQSGAASLLGTVSDGSAVYAGAHTSIVGLDAGFDASESVNTLRVTMTNGITTTTYGPFVDPDAVSRWGPRAADVAVYGTPTQASAEAHAAAWLSRNATPGVHVRSVSLYNSTAARRTLAETLRPEGRLQVLCSEVLHACRISTVTHRVHADRDLRRPATWHTDLTLRPENFLPIPLSATTP